MARKGKFTAPFLSPILKIAAYFFQNRTYTSFR